MDKVFKPFQDLDSQSKKCRTVWTNNKEKLIEIGPKMDGSEMRALNDNSTELEQKINELEEEIRTIKSLGEIPKNFSFWSLFGAMYSILILILIGFEFQFHDTLSLSWGFLWFNISCIILISWLFLREKSVKKRILKKVNASYSTVAVIFLVCFIIGISVSTTLYLINDKKIELSHHFNLIDIYHINAFIAVGIPTYHFVYYTFNSRRNTRKKVNNALGTASSLLHNIELLGKEIHVHSGYAARQSIKISTEQKD